MTEPLDNVIWAALTGRLAGFAEFSGRTARMLPDVGVFAGLEDPADPGCWRDLDDLLGPGGEALMALPARTAPPAYRLLRGLAGVQLVDVRVRAEPDPEAVVLNGADTPDVLDLVARTRPGPFGRRSTDLGTYLGIRRHGRLIAMAGERLLVPGHTEISAVCTDPAYRGQGLAARLIRAVAAGIRERGETPFLHAAQDNVGAVRLYERLGFALRTAIIFAAYRAPDGQA
jgi:ribosomal protein S18 acetylase RimI-like enzyme